MNSTGRKVVLSLRIAAAIFAAVYGAEISWDITTDLYMRIEGHYLPFPGLPYEYYFWHLFLVGALSVTSSYLILYKINNNTLITLAILFVPFTIFALHQYQVSGKPYLSYEIIIGGVIFMGLREAILKKCF